MSLIKAMATVGGWTGISRIAGFIRDIMTASFLGAGPVADAFFVALKLPNFFRNITAEGAFSISFVPLYTETLQRNGKEEAEKFAGNTFSVMASILGIFCAVIILAMPFLMFAIAPGFEAGTTRYDIAVDLSRIMFPYMLLMSLCALVGGMLNAHEKFGPFASTAIFFSLCQIAAMVIAGYFKLDIGTALAWSVTISGIIQLTRLLWYLRRYKIVLPVIKPEMTARVKKLFRLMGPAILGASLIHINLFADIIIASMLPTGAISALYYAERLFQLPLGIIGIAVGTALLPLLTKALTAGNTVEARDLFNRALEYCLFFTMPAAVALVLIGPEIINTLFVHGAFKTEHAVRAAPALACLALGLPAYVGVKIFSSTYWSRQDTKTPVRIAACMALVNIVVALVMTRFIDVAGIALATGISGWAQCFFLWRGIRGQEATIFDARLKRNVLRIVLCSVLMGCVLLLSSYVLEDLFTAGKLQQVMALAALVGSGITIYFSAAYLSGVFKINDLTRYLKRKPRVTKDVP